MKRLILLLLIGLYGCSPAIRTYYDYDKRNNIQKYRTFAWVIEDQTKPRNNPLYYNELTDSRIKGAANDLLRMKGYLLTDQQADLSLRYHIVMEDRSIFLPDADGYFYGDYFMRPGRDIFSYQEITLTIDFTNIKNKNLIWHGWAVGPLEVVTYEMKDTNPLIRSAVTKILLNFPEALRDSLPAVSFR